MRGSQFWLHAAAVLAIHRMQSTAVCGRQSCLQAALQAAVEPGQITHAVGSIFSGFVSRRHGAAKPREIRLASRNGGLKGLQPGLAATKNGSE